ncbi:MAG TPA: phytanoyl-CoA dioxygenase family protein [Acetobacteraceae bacterium]|nr:phytanoyl-CoA dioxygenase family protein [Acetobacteraceae bacterium]
MKALTQEQVESYRRDGFLFPVAGLNATEIAACLAGLERLETALGCAVADADIKWRSHAYAHSPWFDDLIRHPRILDAVEDVIGPDILVWTSTFFIKEPNSPTFAAWHQDGAYFGLQPKEQVCAWVALTDASREAGCMEQLSSRGQPRLRHHAALGMAHSINRAGQTIMEPFDESAPVAMALRAGEFSLHHELAVHRSAPNNASHRRVGIGLNFIPTHVRVDGPVRPMAMLVRGEDRYGHFDLFDPPRAERDAAALALHQRVSERYRENYRYQVERHAQDFAAA